MTERFDAVIIGMGPGGEVVADRLIKAGKRVAVVERELIGGECAYWGCIPSKTMLRPVEVRHEALKAAGVATPQLNWQEARDYRDYMARGLDDSSQVEYYEKDAEVLKGNGRIAGPGQVDVDGRMLETDVIVIATGSETSWPPIDGIRGIGAWTNREATTSTDMPDTLAVIGGGPIGIELGQAYARFGSKVTIIEGAESLLGREDAAVGETVTRFIEADGIELITGARVTNAATGANGRELTLSNGRTMVATEVLVAAGRRPRTTDIGLETLGVDGSKPLDLDERCQLTPGVYVVGDAAGTAMFTHVAKYQARIVAANLLGGDLTASYDAIPRVIFTDPEVAAVGLSAAAAKEQGIDVLAKHVNTHELIARPWTYERDPEGQLSLLVDRSTRKLVGAWAISPLAGEWIHPAVLAIRAGITVDVLLDTVIQFPTFTEAYTYALEALVAEL